MDNRKLDKKLETGILIALGKKQIPGMLNKEIFSYLVFQPQTNQDLKDAVNCWCSDMEKTLRDLGHISNWDTSLITNMSELFCNKSDFNEPLNWDTRRVTDMNCMFWSARRFNQQLNWDTSSVTDMSCMFLGAENFNQPVICFDTSMVTNMYGMFQRAESFNQPLNFDTSSVRCMDSMFYRAINFNQPVRFSIRRNTDIRRMFDHATSFDPNNNLIVYLD